MGVTFRETNIQKDKVFWDIVDGNNSRVILQKSSTLEWNIIKLHVHNHLFVYVCISNHLKQKVVNS